MMDGPHTLTSTSHSPPSHLSLPSPIPPSPHPPLPFSLPSPTPTHPQVMVFFPTARQTAYMAALFNSIGTEVMEIHSRKTQSSRTHTSERFRTAKRGILFSSDVTARGMDYPDVTYVVQCGGTTKEQYVHRLGRTARAGKEGLGLLLCAPFEMRGLQSDLKVRGG